MSTLTVNSSARTLSQVAQPVGFINAISAFFKRIGNAYEIAEAERKEAYLAESADLYDLEYRIRQLDRGTAHTPAWMTVSR